ncbi:18480_t:CDS:1, partial [Gigaspora margarita]
MSKNLKDLPKAKPSKLTTLNESNNTSRSVQNSIFATMHEHNM